MTATKLTAREQEILDQMRREHWTPFPMQLGRLGRSLERKGFIRQSMDDCLRTVYTLADSDGAAAV